LPVELMGVIGSLAVMLAMATTSGPLEARTSVANPFAIDGAQAWIVALRWAGYVTIAAALGASVAALVSRFNHARGDEREQLKWITSAAALSAVALVYGLVRQLIGHELLYDSLTAFFVSTVALPLSIGVAILKYRLYDIDLVINRALVYGGLTALLAGLYTFLVAVTQRLVVFSGQKSDAVILVTAFIAATTFTPVKSRLQQIVDARFAVHDPASSVDAMREQVQVVVNVLDARRIARRLVEECATTYSARYAALSLKADGDGRPLYTFGDDTSPVVIEIALHSRGQEVGVLSLSERRGGVAYTLRDQKALQLYADTVAEAIEIWEGALAHSR
jgi:hypothetical protein